MKNIELPKLNSKSVYAWLLLVIVMIRAFFNGVIPLMDKTEARYSEIARIMSETGDWIVLHIDYGIPFWAKPPLSTWLSAGSISLFGTHEFFVRLPYLLTSILMALWIGRYRPGKEISVFLPGLILFSLPQFYLHAGVVSTDVLLSFSVMMVMLSFWELIQDNAQRKWNYLFFAGLGLGLLAKGPIVGILTLPPIVLWCLRFKIGWRKILHIPWLLGILLTGAICLPWYYLAEVRSPGFIDYFVIGEHFKRFFDSGWKGDKYGFPKSQPFGIIWVFLISLILPWTVLLLHKMIKNFKSLWNDKWQLFLLFWLLWTPLFFTSSKSLIHPYILPVMVPAALLIVSWWPTVKNKKTYISIGLVFPFLFFAVYCTGAMSEVFENNSDKHLLELHSQSDAPLYALSEKSYSSQFYSNGTIQILDEEAFLQCVDNRTPFSIIITNRRYKNLSDDTRQQMVPLAKTSRKGLYTFKANE
jgi:4-amino-4-deoxy-L-arabinose transferase-like glycosyltransferase